MISIKDLSFRYTSKRELFRGVSVDIPTGSIVGLLGRNGEGKSTLMKLIVGQLIAQSGSVINQGIESSLRRTELLQKVYMLPEEVVVPYISVREYFAIISPFYPSYDPQIAEELIQAFEIDWSWNLAKISLGQRKKCLIALAIALRTPLLLLDEPTNGLDIPSKSLFRRVLAKYIGEEQTVIISTHQVRDLEQLIDYILMLDRNQIVCSKSIATLTEKFVFAPLTAERASTAIYREPMMMGEYGIWERGAAEQDNGDFSMELFFNAMVAERERMQAVIGA